MFHPCSVLFEVWNRTPRICVAFAFFEDVDHRPAIFDLSSAGQSNCSFLKASFRARKGLCIPVVMDTSQWGHDSIDWLPANALLIVNWVFIWVMASEAKWKRLSKADLKRLQAEKSKKAIEKKRSGGWLETGLSSPRKMGDRSEGVRNEQIANIFHLERRATVNNKK